MTHDPREAFQQYRRKQIAELRPWQDRDLMTGISVSAEDRKAGSPKPGDMIARNPKNHADQWLVAEAYFADNFEPLTASSPREQKPVAWQIRCNDYCRTIPDNELEIWKGNWCAHLKDGRAKIIPLYTSAAGGAAESNASVEARLREALLRDQWSILVEKDDRTSPEEYPDMCFITREEVAAIIDAALSPGGDEAKKSEGGCICQEQHRRGYCTEPGCPYTARPSDPSADRREIVALELRRFHRNSCYPDALDGEVAMAVKRILAALDGGR